MKGKEAITKENFDESEYADNLREQGYKDGAIPDLVAKKKESLNKSESKFNYIMNLEKVEKSEDDHIIVAGFASSGSLDYDSEAVNQESLQVAWSDYMRNPVLKYLHGKDSRNPDAIGRILPEYITNDGRTIKTEFINNKPFIVAEISNAPDV